MRANPLLPPNLCVHVWTSFMDGPKGGLPICPRIAAILPCMSVMWVNVTLICDLPLPAALLPDCQSRAF